jgi:hypothetical protein
MSLKRSNQNCHCRSYRIVIVDIPARVQSGSIKGPIKIEATAPMRVVLAPQPSPLLEGLRSGLVFPGIVQVPLGSVRVVALAAEEPEIAGRIDPWRCANASAW